VDKSVHPPLHEHAEGGQEYQGRHEAVYLGRNMYVHRELTSNFLAGC
jgi:hypothetical protein